MIKKDLKKSSSTEGPCATDKTNIDRENRSVYVKKRVSSLPHKNVS